MQTNVIVRWIRAHPLLAVTLTWLATLIAAASAGCSDDFRAFCIAADTLLLFGWLLAVFHWNRKITRLLIAFLLLLFPARSKSEEQPILPYAVGAVVVVVSAIVTYKVVQFCQKHFPKEQPPSTNAPPQEVAPLDDNQYAAAFTYASLGSCYSPAPFWAASQDSATLFHVEATLSEADGLPQLTIGSTRTAGDWAMVDAGIWTAQLDTLGLTMNAHGPGQCWSRNGEPVAQEATPISLDPLTRTVSISGPASHVVVVEKSFDLANWETVLSISLPTGYRLELDDVCGTDQMFYRLTAR